MIPVKLPLCPKTRLGKAPWGVMHSAVLQVHRVGFRAGVHLSLRFDHCGRFLGDQTWKLFQWRNGVAPARLCPLEVLHPLGSQHGLVTPCVGEALARFRTFAFLRRPELKAQPRLIDFLIAQGPFVQHVVNEEVLSRSLAIYPVVYADDPKVCACRELRHLSALRIPDRMTPLLMKGNDSSFAGELFRLRLGRRRYRNERQQDA